ncbi:prepilin-type N-terminal cleavage/methylation domain-containing protein [Paenibacillus mesophilus]|uniref:PulJ/GspJ family protein n=1 Tax=Paenibacillus mesophilus TaxID=2582849 RepID=UPI00110EFEFD|nr:prepilin-type N-terminal cleavage/methylation domain-containing protein [Paenibacillus mesophilus]TMV52647.1 prepilin-type N-terminal cleavage/methylation domain-containing protein [Paenibacillus mesophilus]
MNNEKGLTLIELLAAVAVSGILLSVVFLLIHSEQKQFTSRIASHNDRNAINRTMNLITADLSNSSKIFVTGNELRYKAGPKLKSLYYTDGQLISYDFSNDANAANDDADFANASISVTGSPQKYTASAIIAQNLNQAPSYRYNNNPIASILQNGELIQITIAFGGSPASVQTTSVKLISNATTK